MQMAELAELQEYKMTDERQPANRGSFDFAAASPRYTLTCAIPQCQRKHDGTGARKWVKGTKLMMCAACAEQREIRRMEKVAA